MTNTTYSSNDVKQRWGSVMKIIEDPENAVIVSSHGRPKAAVISYERLEQLLEADRLQRRENAWRELEKLAAKQAARNADLSKDDIEALADRGSRDIVASLVAKGHIRFADEKES